MYFLINMSGYFLNQYTNFYASYSLHGFFKPNKFLNCFLKLIFQVNSSSRSRSRNWSRHYGQTWSRSRQKGGRLQTLDNSNDDDDILPGVSGQLPPLDVVDLGELEHLPLPPLTDHPEERIDCSLSVLFKSAKVVTKFTMNQDFQKVGSFNNLSLINTQ